VEAAKPALSHYPTYPSVTPGVNRFKLATAYYAYTPYIGLCYRPSVRLFVRHTDGSVNKKPSCR